MSDDIYVLVVERDTYEPEDSNGAIIFEQMTSKASLEEIQNHPARTSGRYGRTRIAKLEFIEEWK